MSGSRAGAVLITGGTSGIGLATALLLHRRGWQVAVTGRDPGSAPSRRELPPEVLVLRADAASIEDTDRAVGAVRERFGSLTGLFLNAGITRPTPVHAATEEQWDQAFAVNAKGQFFTLQRALPILADGASVVVTVGLGVTRGGAGGSVTAASRGALLAMVPSLAVELAPRRIRVNAVSPGVVDTPIWTRSGMPPERAAEVLGSIAQRVPLGRVGRADDVAEAAAFLLSDAAAYVTGEHLTVGGGLGLGT